MARLVQAQVLCQKLQEPCATLVARFLDLPLSLLRLETLWGLADDANAWRALGKWLLKALRAQTLHARTTFTLLGMAVSRAQALGAESCGGLYDAFSFGDTDGIGLLDLAVARLPAERRVCCVAWLAQLRKRRRARSLSSRSSTPVVATRLRATATSGEKS